MDVKRTHPVSPLVFEFSTRRDRPKQCTTRTWSHCEEEAEVASITRWMLSALASVVDPCKRSVQVTRLAHNLPPKVVFSLCASLKEFAALLTADTILVTADITLIQCPLHRRQHRCVRITLSYGFTDGATGGGRSTARVVRT